MKKQILLTRPGVHMTWQVSFLNVHAYGSVNMDELWNITAIGNNTTKGEIWKGICTRLGDTYHSLQAELDKTGWLQFTKATNDDLSIYLPKGKTRYTVCYF